jgi:hypothetical protein
MKRRRLFHTAAVLATSLAAFGPQAMAKEGGEKQNKKLRPNAERLGSQSWAAANAGPEPPPQRKAPRAAEKKTAPETPPAPKRPVPLESALTVLLGTTAAPAPVSPAVNEPATKYPWKKSIVTTTFWIGEDSAPNNPVPNHASSWDQSWAQSYGGTDTPVRSQRECYMPVSFVPQQNPFYIALPYNDVNSKGHKPEAASIIPWFKEAYTGPGKTVLKGRWIAIRFKDRTAYAQWEDCGPFRTDHSAYVFGDERPKPNLNKGAGLDVSPAVRDYLGMNDTDVTDWRFVDFEEVPRGPWSTHGSNNTFVINDQAKRQPLVLTHTIRPDVQ